MWPHSGHRGELRFRTLYLQSGQKASRSRSQSINAASSAQVAILGMMDHYTGRSLRRKSKNWRGRSLSADSEPTDAPLPATRASLRAKDSPIAGAAVAHDRPNRIPRRDRRNWPARHFRSFFTRFAKLRSCAISSRSRGRPAMVFILIRSSSEQNAAFKPGAISCRTAIAYADGKSVGGSRNRSISVA